MVLDFVDSLEILFFDLKKNIAAKVLKAKIYILGLVWVASMFFTQFSYLIN